MKKLSIDKLEIAYKCTDENKEWLSQQSCIENEYMKVLRVKKETNYKNSFEIYTINGILIAELYFGSYNINRQYIYLRIDNRMLYEECLGILSIIEECLNLEFVQISKLDLALDYNKNIINKFYKIYKNTDLNIIILNKAIKLDNEVNDLLTICKGTRLNITKNKSVYIQNKEKGLTLSIYNKLKEIEDNNFEKQYIIDKLNFNKIYRIEIRTNHNLLKDTLNKIGFTDSYLYQCIVNNITDELFLIYCNLLNRLIRIEYKRNSINLLECFE